MSIEYINNLINAKFHTDLGYMYFYHALKNKYPMFQINEDNVRNLVIQKMDMDKFLNNNYVALYKANNNAIEIFTNKDEQGNVLDSNYAEFINPDTILNAFVHEFIHLLTSYVALDGTVYEGLNARTKDGTNSFFIGLNEGITQMLANDLIGEPLKDAYPIETCIANQLAIIMGKEKLLELYSHHDMDAFARELCKYTSPEMARNFIILTYTYYCIINYNAEAEFNLEPNIGTIIQSWLLDFYNASGVKADKEFEQLFMSYEKIIHMCPNLKSFCNFPKLGFVGDEELKFNPNERKENKHEQ